MSSKKPSGSQNRKKKKLEAQQAASFATSLDNFITKKPRLLPSQPQASASTSIEFRSVENTNVEIGSISQSQNLELIQGRNDDEIHEPHDGINAGSPATSTDQEDSVILKESQLQIQNKPDTSKRDQLDSGDPGSWPRTLTDATKLYILSTRVTQVINHNFPTNENNRKFNKHFYTTQLSNGEKCNRRWLLYSIMNDSVFCLACKFNPKSTMKLGTDGLSDWKHLSDYLRQHESSKFHKENMKNLIDLENGLEKGKTVDAQAQRLINLEIQKWKSVFQRLFAITQFLAENNIAFRGSSDRLYQQHNGNFLSVVQLIAKFDPIMQHHVSRALRRDISDHYLSNVIQNELIQVLSNATQAKILNALKQAKYYTIIVDCTPDISKKEQVSLSVRFVDFFTNLKNVRICEHFLEFVKAHGSTGEKMTDLILERLRSFGIPIQDCRGQAYDNGSNMKGKNIGVQRRILDLNPRAFYVPCAAHTLNLVVSDSAKSSLNGINFFGFVSKMYAFFSGSTQRWSVLKQFATELTLKPLSETRWESRIDSLKVLRYQLFEVYSALIELSDTLVDQDSKYEAETLANYMCNFHFMVCIVIWHEILFHVVLTSKKMQGIETDIKSCVNEISKVKSFLQGYRRTGFEDAVKKASGLALELGIDPEFQKSHEKRIRRKNRMFSYENPDESVIDPKKKFEVEFFNVIVDTCINKISERFKQLSEHAEIFGILYDLPNLLNAKEVDILKSCKNMQMALDFQGISDISSVELAEELKHLRNCTVSESAFETLHYLVENGYEECFPNTFIALRILLTLPVTVATGERSFSRLKLILTYLRSTMSQERLSGLAILSIENKVASLLDVENLISDFANKKVRKVPLK